MKINAEDPWLNAFILSPGVVDTEGGLAATAPLGIPPEALSNVEDVSRDLLKVISGATKEKFGGKFVSPTGEVEDW